jgi:hypothetical protein
MKKLLIKRTKLKLIINSMYGSTYSPGSSINTLTMNYNMLTKDILRIKKRIIKIKRILDAGY